MAFPGDSIYVVTPQNEKNLAFACLYINNQSKITGIIEGVFVFHGVLVVLQLQTHTTHIEHPKGTYLVHHLVASV